MHKFATINGIQISYFDWNVDGERTVLLCHATGFHGRCWDAVVRYLPENVRVIAIEHRGHGRSEKSSPYTWTTFGDDLVHFTQVLDLANVVGVGHSMGGYTLVYAAAKEPERFNQLLLLDPVIMSPERYTSDSQFSDVDQHPVARRVNHWESSDAMYEKFSARHPFSLWKPDVLRDYCRFGLETGPDPEDQKKPFRLCCPPEVEASVYVGNTDGNIHPLLPEVRLPVTIFRARERSTLATEMDFSQSPTWPELATHLPSAQDRYLPFLSHFIPMQDPFLVATQINLMVAQVD